MQVQLQPTQLIKSLATYQDPVTKKGWGCNSVQRSWIQIPVVPKSEEEREKEKERRESRIRYTHVVQ